MRFVTALGYSIMANVLFTIAAPCLSQELSGESSSVSSWATAQPPPEAGAQPISSHGVRQENWLPQPQPDTRNPARRFLDDQKDIWTSPARLRMSDAEWLVPTLGLTTGMILTDSSFSHSLSSNPGRLHDFNTVRNASLASIVSLAGGLTVWSLHTHDPHERETGILAGEAVMNSLVLVEGMKYVTGRERPDQGTGQGNFFQGGNSFPSAHAATAWAAAGILAHEYPGPLTKLFAYGMATTVSIASVGSKQHFPSDVLIGSGIGWLVSEYVYRTHHNPELGGSAWSSIGNIVHDERRWSMDFPGSSYVPLDSWVYPALERLSALGYVNSAFQGAKPWSRQQCARLLGEADEAMESSPAFNSSLAPELRNLIAALHREFFDELRSSANGNRSLEAESLYSRVTSVSGAPLTDAYHFGQTNGYDFGRPFRRGTNFISGGSASATYGSIFFYASGEYQHAPSAPALSLAERQFIATADRSSIAPGLPLDPVNRFVPLDTYVGINLHEWQISFGKQSLDWGPGPGGSLLLSDNAAPITMLRILPAAPTELPGISRFLGPLTFEQFFGRLDGHAGLSQPWIYGQKIDFKPIRSLEFSYGRTTMIGGSGHPLTSGKFLESMFGRVDSTSNSVPGDSRTSVDWTWRLPGLHDRVVFYGELEDDDDLIPLQNLSKSVLRPGIYLPRLPLLSRWDLHFEWTTSASPGRASFQAHGDLNYWNQDYTDGYTNEGTLLGNTVGREGQTLQAWTRYWISPRHTLDFSWKQSRVFSDYIPRGGNWQDVQAGYSRTLDSGFYLKTFVQYERILSFPLLFSGTRNNVTASVEIGYSPRWVHGHQANSQPVESRLPNPTGEASSR